MGREPGGGQEREGGGVGDVEGDEDTIYIRVADDGGERGWARAEAGREICEQKIKKICTLSFYTYLCNPF